MQFQIGNTRISFSVWFFAVISLFALFSEGNLVIYLAAPVILHEAGHAAMIAVCGAEIERIRFTAFGIEIEKYGEPAIGYAKEIAVSVAGAAVNILTGLIFYFFMFRSMRAMLFSAANFAVAAFNLMPIGNLDGGELARLVSDRYFTQRTAFTLSRAFSFAALVPLFAAAIFILIQPGRNFTLLLVCCYLLLDIIFQG